MDDFVFWFARRLGTGELSSLGVVEARLCYIDVVNTKLNAAQALADAGMAAWRKINPPTGEGQSVA